MSKLGVALYICHYMDSLRPFVTIIDQCLASIIDLFDFHPFHDSVVLLVHPVYDDIGLIVIDRWVWDNEFAIRHVFLWFLQLTDLLEIQHAGLPPPVDSSASLVIIYKYGSSTMTV